MKNSRVALGSTSLRPATKSSRVTCSASSCAVAGGIIQAKRARGQKAAQGNHADFLAQGFEVGADVAVGSLGDILQVHV